MAEYSRRALLRCHALTEQSDTSINMLANFCQNAKNPECRASGCSSRRLGSALALRMNVSACCMLNKSREAGESSSKVVQSVL